MSLLPDAVSILGGAMDVGNFAISLANQAYMKKMQKEEWNREDTAVQRRMADLKSAGINPLLAAGQSASTSAPIQVGVPQGEANNAERLSALLRNRQGIEQTKAQTLLTEAQMQNALDANVGQRITNNILNTQLEKEKYNLKLSAERGLRTDDHGVVNDVLSGIQALGTQLKTGGVLRSAVNGIWPAIEKYLNSTLYPEDRRTEERSLREEGK